MDCMELSVARPAEILFPSVSKVTWQPFGNFSTDSFLDNARGLLDPESLPGLAWILAVLLHRNRRACDN